MTCAIEFLLRIYSTPQAEYNSSENGQARTRLSDGKRYLPSWYLNDFETELAFVSVSDSRVLDRIIRDP